MMTLTVLVKVKPEKRKEFLQTIHSLDVDQERHEGLKKFTLTQEIEDETSFDLIYEWESREDLERYVGAEKFRVLLGALKVLGEKSEIKHSRVPEQGING